MGFGGFHRFPEYSILKYHKLITIQKKNDLRRTIKQRQLEKGFQNSHFVLVFFNVKNSIQFFFWDHDKEKNKIEEYESTCKIFWFHRNYRQPLYPYQFSEILI